MSTYFFKTISDAPFVNTVIPGRPGSKSLIIVLIDFRTELNV